MPMPALSASRANRKCTSSPASRIVPVNSPCTAAMIFISVDLPAPFSPTSPWISPVCKEKSTSRSAWTPPNDFEMPTISSSAALPSVTGQDSDQEVVFHPLHARRVRLGDDRTISHDILGDSLAGLFARQRCNTGDDRAAMDAAGGIADRREHAPVSNRGNGGRHGVDPAKQNIHPALRLHDIVSGERHVVVV